MYIIYKYTNSKLRSQMLSGTCSGDVGKDEDKRHELIKRRSLSGSMVQELLRKLLHKYYYNSVSCFAVSS